MRTRVAIGIGALLLLGLSACGTGTGTGGSGDGYGGGYGSETQSASPQSEEPMQGGAASLKTAQTPLGTVVVDQRGDTVYQFDHDTRGAPESSCSGQCLVNWPPVPAGQGTPRAKGITGELGSITGSDGKAQLTLNGWPLYYFAGDRKPGDTAGQGVDGVWWVLTPAGEPITQ